MNNKGFTLIELLVVVLIIGILAAIALPQYTKAVERSRLSEAVQVLGDLATAQSIYYMENNTFATNIGKLNEGDITFPVTGSGDSAVYSGSKSFKIEVNGATLTAERNGGMYGQENSKGKLQIIVGTDGSIAKSCTPANGDFCKLAATAGY